MDIVDGVIKCLKGKNTPFVLLLRRRLQKEAKHFAHVPGADGGLACGWLPPHSADCFLFQESPTTWVFTRRWVGVWMESFH